MKVLIYGPSGSGKTYLSSQLKLMGHPAIDGDTIDGLSGWFDGLGNRVEYRVDADEEFLENHSFLWSRDFLEKYLADKGSIYIFGAAGNTYEVFDLFDEVYFLKVPIKVQQERLIHPSRENPMGMTKYQREQCAKWAHELYDEAQKYNIPIIDATLTPQEIWEIISKP